jgi:hypothetical protein
MCFPILGIRYIFGGSDLLPLNIIFNTKFGGKVAWMERVGPGSFEFCLPEKLTGPELVKKLLSFHENRRFITALTTARYLSLS